MERLVVGLVAMAGCVSPERQLEPQAAPLSTLGLEEIADRLVADAGSPGAVLGVSRGDERWSGASGTTDLDGTVPMPIDAVFRAGSLTKLYTGSLVLQQVADGALSLDDRLADTVPTFPNADAITLDALLSHTAGVTPLWLEDPALQATVVGALDRQWSIDEVITEMSALAPLGVPGETPMTYSNTDFVLLGAVLEATTGRPFVDQVSEDLLGPLGLSDTTYTFVDPERLVSGYFEFAGLVLDATAVAQTAIVSFAGPAGAIHTTTADLLAFADALFRQGAVVDPDGLDVLTTPAEAGSWYGHATMRFCPCPDGPGVYTGWGHGGNLPGYWSVVVYYPDSDVIVTAAVNRDTVDGVPLDVSVFDATLTAVLERLEGP